MNELRLERMVHGGVAIGRVAGGRVVLVKGGIPGELVRIAVDEVSGVLRGEVTEVIEPSLHRLPAPRHPGLDFGFIRYPAQLEFKRSVVIDALRRAWTEDDSALEVVEEVQAAPSIWRYRSAIQPLVTSRGLAYRNPGTSSATLLASDPVANAGAARAWALISSGGDVPKGVREVAVRGDDEGGALVALIATSPQRTLLPYAHALVEAGVRGVAYARFDARGRFRGGSERLAGVRRLLQRYGEFDLSVTVTSFAQPNPGAAGELYRRVPMLVGSGKHAVELFAGSGAIALHLSSAFTTVEAIEIDRGSVTRGRQDADRLGIDNVTFEAGDARRWEIPPSADLVAVDPPRAGLGKEVRERIDASAAGRLLYVSCDPATWARDVAHFVSSGWSLVRAQPFDFYPHTHHVEMLSLLTR